MNAMLWVPLARVLARQCSFWNAAQQTLAAQSCRQWHPNRLRFRYALLTIHFLLGIAVSHAGEPRRLTDSGKLKFSPAFINDGQDVVFVELTDPTIYRLQRLILADGKIEPLHAEATTSEFEPAFAADGQCYAYLKTRGPLSVSIMIHDAKRNPLGEIPPDGGFCGYRTPTLAPGKSRLAYSFAEKGTQQIYSSRLNGEDRRQLTDSTGLNFWPAFSPDGRSIAFGSSRDGNYEIYVMQADGTDVRRLTDHPMQDIRPKFSPDCRRIVFTSHRDENAEIYFMSANGTNLRRLTDHPERDDYADWHPDGKHIITVSERDGRYDLYLWDMDPSPSMP